MTQNAFLCVNGMQTLRCEIPGVSELRCSIDDNAVHNLRVMADFGRFEVSTVLYTSPGMHDCPFVANLIVEFASVAPAGGNDDDDDDVEATRESTAPFDMAFGQLPDHDKARSMTRYVCSVPAKFTLVVEHGQPPYRHHDESLLVQEVAREIRKNRFELDAAGRVTMSHVRTAVGGSRAFGEVVGWHRAPGHYGANFQTFLEANGDAFSVLKPDGRGEAHVELRGYTPSPPAAMDDDELVDVVRGTILSADDGRMTWPELLERLSTQPLFQRGLKPHAETLRMFMQAHADIFWVATDNVHATRCGLRHH
jgi:hypothetical protein